MKKYIKYTENLHGHLSSFSGPSNPLFYHVRTSGWKSRYGNIRFLRRLGPLLEGLFSSSPLTLPSPPQTPTSPFSSPPSQSYLRFPLCRFNSSDSVSVLSPTSLHLKQVTGGPVVIVDLLVGIVKTFPKTVGLNFLFTKN